MSALFEAQRAAVVRRRASMVFAVGSVFYAGQLAVGTLWLAPAGHRAGPALLFGPMFVVALAALILLRRARGRRHVELAAVAAFVALAALSGTSTTPPYDLAETMGASFVIVGAVALVTQFSWRGCAALLAGTWLALVAESFALGTPQFVAPTAAVWVFAMLVLHARSRDRLLRSEHEARAELEAAVEQLRRSEDARSRLFINMSHDFRTPLAVIRGEAELLRPGARSDAESTALSRIEWNARAIADLTEQLLELARMEAGSTPLRRLAVDLVALARESAAQLSPSGGDARIEVHAGAEPVVADADPQHVRRILANLIGNALRATRSGGGLVEIAVRRDGPCVIVDVVDDGVGIALERRAVIFERFVSFDPAGSVASGIGLPLARELAELNGGGVLLREDEPRTTFRLTLPASDAAPQELEAPARPAPVPARDGILAAGGPAVLVVEDNPEMADVLVRLLGARWPVRTASSLSAGRAALRSDGAPLAVVADVMLPDGDGYAVLEHLRDAHGPVPFLFVSAMGDHRERARGLRAGADDYVAKPFSGDELVARVAGAIDRAEARQRALASQRQEFLAELHDGMGASLTRAALSLESQAGGAPGVEDALAAIRDGLVEARAMMTLLEARDEPWRAVVADVRRETADACGRAGLAVQFDIVGDDDDMRLSPAEALTARRVAREALTNVLKHAGARTVACALRLREGRVQLLVEDDGRGIPPGPSHGRGLSILARRVARLGGLASFGVRPAGGSFVDAAFPLTAATGAGPSLDRADPAAAAAPGPAPAPALAPA